MFIIPTFFLYLDGCDDGHSDDSILYIDNGPLPIAIKNTIHQCHKTFFFFWKKSKEIKKNSSKQQEKAEHSNCPNGGDEPFM